jgi:RecA-family ATPase
MKTLKEMINEIDIRPPANDLIQDLLPDSSNSYMLICGRSGIGKTFLALDILFCLASDTPWFSHRTRQCKAGYLSMEGSDRKIKERFETISKSFNHDAQNNIYWQHTMAMTLNQQGITNLESIVTGLTVVIIDPMRPLVAGDYTSPKDATQFLKNLQKVQNETGVRVILLHHIRKPDKKVKVQPEDLQFEVKGASEYVEGANTVLLLERAPQPKDLSGKFLPKTNDRMLHFVKIKDAPIGEKPIRLHFDTETKLFQPVSDTYGDDDIPY